jgi:hypothetical protein
MGLKSKIVTLLILLFVFSVGISCGIYSLSGSTLPAHIKTVAIPLFSTRSPEFGIDQEITDSVIEAVTRDNTLKIADERSSDSLIRGTILQITDSAGAYDQNENASNFRVTIRIKIIFEDLKKQNVMWEETWTHWGEYTSDRSEGIKEATDKIAEAIINRTVSGW